MFMTTASRVTESATRTETTPLRVATSPARAAMTRERFWESADKAKEATEALAAEKMKVLERLPPEALQRVCVQYRFFTIDYIRDLALLVSELPFGKLRSLLGQILAEELGEGDPAKAHRVLGWEREAEGDLLEHLEALHLKHVSGQIM